MSPFIGSEVWVQPWHTPESIYAQFKQMKQYGMTQARIFLDWRHVEEEQGVYDFTLYDTVFQAAEENKIGLQVTLMHLNWLPRWRQKAIIKQDSFYNPELENCELRDTYVRNVVQRYKDSPAMAVWILANEPRLTLPKTEVNLAKFREFLIKQHKNTDELYKLYGTRNAENIGDVRPDGSVHLGVDSQWEFAGDLDWAKMETETLMGLLRRTKEIIREADKQHPITVNPDDISKANLLDGGRDIWQMGKVTDFLGMSCHVAWHSTRFGEDKIHQSVSMFCDMTRSATSHKDDYFQVTELQAGTNYFSGVRPTCPSAQELSRWIWDLIGGGAKGIVYWLLNPRDHGFEGLEWGLNNQAGKASARTLASRKASDILSSLKILEKAKPLPPQVYLLHDIDSLTLGILESRLAGVGEEKQNPRNRYLIADALCGAYCMLYDMGYRVGFVNGEGISSLPNDTVLIAPNTYAPSNKTVDNIQQFVKNGGQLLADGLFAVKDPYGNRIESRDKIMEDIFGGILEDFEVSSDKFFMNGEAGFVPGFYLKGTFEESRSRKVLARWEDQGAAVIQKENSTYIATQLFQGYFAKEGNVQEAQGLIKHFLPEQSGVALKNPSAQLHLRAMDSVIIITNSGSKTTAKMQNMEAGVTYTTLAGIAVTDEVEVEENGYQILLCN